MNKDYEFLFAKNTDIMILIHQWIFIQLNILNMFIHAKITKSLKNTNPDFASFLCSINRYFLDYNCDWSVIKCLN